MPSFDEVRKLYPGWSDLDIVRSIAADNDTTPEYVAGYLGARIPKRNTGLLGDLATSGKRGLEAMPGMVTGLADIPFALAGGGRPFDTAANALGGLTGFQPSRWAQEAAYEYSPGYQQAQQEIGQAWDTGGAANIAGAYLSNPAYILNQTVESLPGMVGGGLIGRALTKMAAGGALTQAERMALAESGASVDDIARAAMQAANPIRNAAIGEGAVTSGQLMNQFGPEVDPQRAALAALGAGAVTGGIGYGAGQLANRFGLVDLQTALAGQRVAGGEARDLLSMATARKMLGGAAEEGVLQEFPQSFQEQMWQNWAAGAPLTEGAVRQGVEGMLAGGLLGGATNFRGNRGLPDINYVPPVTTEHPYDLLGGSPAAAGGATQQPFQVETAPTPPGFAAPGMHYNPVTGVYRLDDPSLPAGRAAAPEMPQLQPVQQQLDLSGGAMTPGGLAQQLRPPADTSVSPPLASMQAIAAQHQQALSSGQVGLARFMEQRFPFLVTGYGTQYNPAQQQLPGTEAPPAAAPVVPPTQGASNATNRQGVRAQQNGQQVQPTQAKQVVGSKDAPAAQAEPVVEIARAKDSQAADLLTPHEAEQLHAALGSGKGAVSGRVSLPQAVIKGMANWLLGRRRGNRVRVYAGTQGELALTPEVTAKLGQAASIISKVQELFHEYEGHLGSVVPSTNLSRPVAGLDNLKRSIANVLKRLGNAKSLDTPAFKKAWAKRAAMYAEMRVRFPQLPAVGIPAAGTRQELSDAMSKLQAALSEFGSTDAAHAPITDISEQESGGGAARASASATYQAGNSGNDNAGAYKLDVRLEEAAQGAKQLKRYFDELTSLLGEANVEAIVAAAKAKSKGPGTVDSDVAKANVAGDVRFSVPWAMYKDGALSAKNPLSHVRDRETRQSEEDIARTKGAPEFEPLVAAAKDGVAFFKGKAEKGILGVLNHYRLKGTPMEKVLATALHRVFSRMGDGHPGVRFLSQEDLVRIRTEDTPSFDQQRVVRGFFRLSDNTIYLPLTSKINGALVGTTPETMLHEALHAALLWYTKHNPTHPAVVELAKIAERIFDAAKAHPDMLPYVKAILKSKGGGAVPGTGVTLNQVSELISYALTSRKFSDAIATLPSGSDQKSFFAKVRKEFSQFWDGIVNLMHAMFGGNFRAGKGNLMTDIANRTAELLRDASNNPEEATAPHRSKRGKSALDATMLWVRNPNSYEGDSRVIEHPTKDHALAEIRKHGNDARALMRSDGRIVYAFSPELLHEPARRGLGLAEVRADTNIGYVYRDDEGTAFYPVYLQESSSEKGVVQAWYRNSGQMVDLPPGAFSGETGDAAAVRAVVDTLFQTPDEVGNVLAHDLEEMGDHELKMDVDKAAIAGLLAQRLYGKAADSAAVATKELFQNAADALKGAIEHGLISGGATVDINVDRTEHTIEVIDNGVGMTPEVVKKAFFTLAGSHKETARPSGGFGIAKMQFLSVAEEIRLVTVKDGTKTTVRTTGAAVAESFTKDKPMPKGSMTVEKTDLPNGTGVWVKLPAQHTDSNGVLVDIEFPWSVPPAVKNSPLLEDIAVKYNGDTLSIGRFFPQDDYVPVATAKFSWGSARVMVSKQAPKYASERATHILSNGVWQFKTSIKPPNAGVWDDDIPHTVYINLEPTVDAKSADYPIDMNRQGFSAAAQKDMARVMQIIGIKYGVNQTLEHIESYGMLRAANAAGEITDMLRLAPEIAEESREKGLYVPPDAKMEVRDGRLFIEGKEIPEFTKQDLEQYKRPDLGEYKVPQNLVPRNLVLVHESTEFNATTSDDEWKPAVEFGRDKFGKRFGKYLHALGGLMMDIRQHIATLPGFSGYADIPMGVTFTDEAYGVHSYTPFQAVMLNPVQSRVMNYGPSTLADRALAMVSTVIHEAVHFNQSNHSETGFIPEMQQLFTRIAATDPKAIAKWVKRMETILRNNGDIYDYFQSAQQRVSGKSLKSIAESAAGAGVRGSRAGLRKAAQRQEGGGRDSVGNRQAAKITDDNLIDRLAAYEGAAWAKEQRAGRFGKYGVPAIVEGIAEHEAEYGLEEAIAALDNRVIYGNGGYNRYVVTSQGAVRPIPESFHDKGKYAAAEADLVGEPTALDFDIADDGTLQYDPTAADSIPDMRPWARTSSVLATPFDAVGYSHAVGRGEKALEKAREALVKHVPGAAVFASYLDHAFALPVELREALDITERSSNAPASQANALGNWIAKNDPKDIARILTALDEYTPTNADSLAAVTRKFALTPHEAALVRDYRHALAKAVDSFTTLLAEQGEAGGLMERVAARINIARMKTAKPSDLARRVYKDSDIRKGGFSAEADPVFAATHRPRTIDYNPDDPDATASVVAPRGADGARRTDGVFYPVEHKSVDGGDPVVSAFVHESMVDNYRPTVGAELNRDHRWFFDGAGKGTMRFTAAKESLQSALESRKPAELAADMRNTIDLMDKTISADRMAAAIRDIGSKHGLVYKDAAALYAAHPELEGVTLLSVGTLSQHNSGIRRAARRPDMWLTVPDTPTYGKLRGMIVNGSVWAAVLDIHHTEPFFNSPLVNSVMRWFKKSKTAYSPGTHIVNIGSNVAWAYLHDIPFAAVWEASKVARAALMAPEKLTAEQRRIWTAFVDSGALLADYSSAETAAMLSEALETAIRAKEGDAPGSLWESMKLNLVYEKAKAAKLDQHLRASADKAKAVDEFATAAYAAEDNIFRLAAFMSEVGARQRAKGVALDADELGKAAKFSAEAFLDYNIHARAINVMKQTVTPFVSWPYRAIPAMAKIAATKPWKMAGMFGAYAALEAMFVAMTGGDDEDKRRRKVLPSYMNERLFGFGPHMYFQLPGLGDDKHPVYFKFGSFVPLGDLIQTDNRAGLFGQTWFPQQFTPNGPIVSTLAGALFNVDTFTGKPISSGTDSQWVAFVKRAMYLEGQFTPPWADAKRALETKDVLFNDKQGAFGATVSKDIAVAKIAGLRLQQIDLAAAARGQQATVKAITTEYTKAISKAKHEADRFPAGDKRNEALAHVKELEARKKDAIREAKNEGD